MRALTATLLLTAVLGCSATGRTPTAGAPPPVGMGCEGPAYPAPATSQYILPYAPGLRFPTGLTNCSSSFHGAGEGDQYAYDFNMPVGTPFIAMRAGRVAKVVNDQPDEGEDGGAGNFLVIDHEDGTFGLYYHSPKGGIAVAVGAEVEQGA
ncbi:MAG: M23 family metallopeptidase, partial [Myxococcales bacterium]|nr:M23 family metallopeptidase [Myxococcales bacterium]